MAFLVIGGVTVLVKDGTFKEGQPKVGGSIAVPMFDGTIRTTFRWKKRMWTCQTALMIEADVNTLIAAMAFGTVVAASGDALGGALNVIVTYTDITPTSTTTSDGKGFMRALTLSIQEAQ